jgi:alpha-L-fucosidase
MNALFNFAACLTKFIVSSLLIACFLCGKGMSGEEGGASLDHSQAPAEALAQWRSLKFGLFLHWGPVSLEGTEIGWSRAGERRGSKGTGTIPVEVYDNLYKKFNPEKFDAKEWVALAKAAGMRYLVITSKHHDGFAMFDTKLSAYKITSPDSPYRRDIVKQLADACHEAGLKFGVYYSQVDWHHPEYRTDNHRRYIEYLHGQIKELFSQYGRIDMLFFDGLGGTAEDWDAQNLFKVIRGLQPNVIINNRCGLPADYDTPEQAIGEMQTGRAWETCMTLGQQWSWKPDDTIKSREECIQTLVKVAGGDGNFLFNIGPMPDGRIEPRQADRLKEIGDWLSRYGESIYETRGGPFPRGDWGASTYKGDTVYLHILDPSQDTIHLPPIERKIVETHCLTSGTLAVNQGIEGIEVSVPKENLEPIDTIVILRLDGPVVETLAESSSDKRSSQ